MKKEQRDVWISDDNYEFDTALECQTHEALLAEKELIDEFLETQRWSPTNQKGYTDRTLTTIRRMMTDFIKYKVKRDASKRPAQTPPTESGPEV